MPMTMRDLTNQKFGRLTARWPEGRTSGRDIVWLCSCDCGQLRHVSSSSLKRGNTKSCGCLRIEVGKIAGARRLRHGHARRGRKSAEYIAFVSAQSRCTNKNVRNYKNYGGRGIEFRFTSLEQFLTELGPRPAGMSLDRISNNGHYEPGNVRWATPKEQSNNRRK